MKTICIKTNNQLAINYLLENLKTINLDNVYFSCHKFKVFNNIFIHYKGKDINLFLNYISEILTSLVLDNFENTILKKILSHEYFYFDNIEKSHILENSQNIILEDEELIDTKENILFNTFLSFLNNNNKLYLKGFITFRLKNYISELEKIIDNSVNQYLIEKEYDEFVSLLRLYVNSENSKCDLVHLVCNGDEPILLDSNKKIIKTELNIMNAKYLSDISFSSSDIILNTLLTILPKKIYIHIPDEEEDNFISTLELIFEDRISICHDCNICRLYKKHLRQKFD